ncbi:hypothetical protein WR25_19053 [Diploscapter pachys]|uniref:Sodium/potassium-transporting ATPase subunit beta-1-interacting protein n=1 Tax=Diploscapter pachys TaxID=2018661 RepID=A0A2A2JJQ0_9BILA|nr:hypothetical protein WR25_19053 [Diploscapter pachys]
MGFFGVLQRRRSLIYALMVCIILSVAENVLIFLWYMSIFGNPSQSQALSLGLPYSYSFFLRHTPWCISNFDLLKSQWIQHNCILPYYYIESVQALLHAAVAILIFGFSIAYLCQNSKSSNSSNGSLRHQHNEAYYTEINRDNKASPSSSASQQTVNGYLNSSFTEEEGDIRSRVETSESRMSKDKDGERSSSAETEEYGKRILPLPRTNVSGTSKQKVAKAILPLPHPSAPARTRLFKKVNHKERRSAHMDEENEFQTESSSSSSSRLTSLVSLDLRSPAPVQVQEHYESESSDGSDTIYEKITRGSEYIENIAKNELPPCNSHDSAPSTLAPILIFDENNVASPSRMNPDSGIEYPKPPARMDLWKTASMSSPSSSTTTISSPGENKYYFSCLNYKDFH